VISLRVDGCKSLYRPISVEKVSKEMFGVALTCRTDIIRNLVGANLRVQRLDHSGHLDWRLGCEESGEGSGTERQLLELLAVTDCGIIAGRSYPEYVT
jgi:hypothetical protein